MSTKRVCDGCDTCLSGLDFTLGYHIGMEITDYVAAQQELSGGRRILFCDVCEECMKKLWVKFGEIGIKP